MFRATKYIVTLGGVSAGIAIPILNDVESIKSKFANNFSKFGSYSLNAVSQTMNTFGNTDHKTTNTYTNIGGSNTSIDINDDSTKAAVGWIIVQSKDKGIKDKPLSYTISHIKDNFEKRGFDMRVVDSANIDIYLTNYDRKSILVNDVITPKPDFVLSRTGANTSFATLAVYRHLERLGVPVINRSESVEACKDKLYSLQILAQNNIPVPKTILLTFPVNVKYVVKRLGLPLMTNTLKSLPNECFIHSWNIKNEFFGSIVSNKSQYVCNSSSVLARNTPLPCIPLKHLIINGNPNRLTTYLTFTGKVNNIVFGTGILFCANICNEYNLSLHASTDSLLLITGTPNLSK